VSTADAVDRETAWLQTSGDGLPALPVTAGGAWSVVSGYWPRTAAKRATGQLYVLRRSLEEKRFANQRRLASYEFELKLVWPHNSGAGDAQADQRAFDAAIDAVLVRVGGFVGDKTHGGRFLSVAEEPHWVRIHWEDPAVTLPTEAAFHATVIYHADDIEITG